MDAPTLDQTAQGLNLAWTHGDPVAMSFVVMNASWAGTYKSEVRSSRLNTSALLATITVVATSDGAGNTSFVLTCADTSLVPVGTSFWDLQQVSGVTRISGEVKVSADVTA